MIKKETYAAMQLESVYELLGEMLNRANEEKDNAYGTEAKSFNQGLAAGYYIVRGVLNAKAEAEWQKAKSAEGIV